METDYVDYVKHIVSLMIGSKQANMIPFAAVEAASKREPLIHRSLTLALAFSPRLHTLLSKLQRESQLANAGAAALMMANMGAAGVEAPPFDWKMLKAACEYCLHKQKQGGPGVAPGQHTLSKATFVQYMTAHQVRNPSPL